MTDAGNEKPSIAGLARVRLGHSELTVRPIGLGCMGMSQFYGATDDDETITTIRAAINLGVNFLDTPDIYGGADVGLGVSIRGFGHNEQRIGQAIAGHRDELVLVTKFAAKLSDDHTQVVIDGRAEYVTKCEPLGSAKYRRSLSVAPTPSIPSPRCKASTRYGSAELRAPSRRRAVNWASRWCPTALWAGPRSPAHSRQTPPSHTETSVSPTPAFPPLTSRPISCR
jgi:Aldo/keto reductase family